MKNLKRKVFITLFTILTIFSLTILFIFNYQDYVREKSNIKDSLVKLNDNRSDKKPEFNERNEDDYIPQKPVEDNVKRFIDAKIYSVILTDDGTIKSIISHTEDDTISDEVNSTVTNIIKNGKKNSTYIGNLYKDKYSYKYEDNLIILVDNSDSNNKLLTSLKVSIIIFIVLEIIIYLISKILSKWIIKPAEDSFNKQKEFIADASHELKTPLAVIMASAEAMEKDNDKKWLNNIQSESERMNKLIKDLLDLAKMDNDKIKKVYEVVNLSKLTEKSILTLESLIYEKNIKLDYNIDDNINFKCNGDEIKQLLAILLDNAIKHSQDKGKIIINLNKVKDNIVLEIKNKGLPIPKGEEERIFERFYRVDKSRNRNDNRYGLGLAIAKEIVSRHNGNISASSNNGYTTFKVIFKSTK